MGYAIGPDNRFEEELTLSVSARCACGATTSEASGRRAPAGRVGTSELIEAVITRLREPATCGHHLTRSIGLLTSRYRLPGSARWVGAGAELTGAGDPAIRLVSVDPADLGTSAPCRISLGTDDFELARLLGQPASVVGAWHGALMAALLGHEAHFPCGEHLTLLVAPDAEHAAALAGTLTPAAEPLCLTDCRPADEGLGPSGWFGPGTSAAQLWALADAPGLAGELIDEARRNGLGVATCDGRLRLTLRSELLFEEIALGPVIARALAHARHPRVEAGFSFLTIRRQLARRAEILQAVLSRFAPDSWRMGGDGREVILRRGERESSLDLSCLAVATPSSLDALLSSVLEPGEIPGPPEPRS